MESRPTENGIVQPWRVLSEQSILTRPQWPRILLVSISRLLLNGPESYNISLDAIMPFVQWKTQVDQHDLHTHTGWRSHRVELPLSIIVGCLPTLHPLYNRLACLQKRGSRKIPKANSDNSYALKEVRKGESITQTKDMYVDTSSMESRYEQYTWQIEDRVWGLIGHGKRGYGQAIDERIPRVAHQASWRLRSGLEITALCFWIFVQIWIRFSAFMIYEFVFNTSDSSTFVISCKQSILLRYVCS